jgi:hypothetical protein
MMHLAGKAQCRWSRLTSNVRPHKQRPFPSSHFPIHQMDASLKTQIFALLFQVDGTVRVFAETISSDCELSVPNTEQGLSSLLDWMAARFDRNCQPLLCCSAVEGVEVGGILLEELVASDEVCRFLMAKPFYLNYAREAGLDPSSPATLLRAARQHAPGIHRAA